MCGHASSSCDVRDECLLSQESRFLLVVHEKQIMSFTDIVSHGHTVRVEVTNGRFCFEFFDGAFFFVIV